jgi:type IV secretion system protein VirB11
MLTAQVVDLLNGRLGKDLLAHLERPDVVELLLNEDGKLWLDTYGGMIQTEQAVPPQRARSIITAVSGSSGATTHKDSPILETELPGSGYRFTGTLPPVVKNPIFSIRKRASRIFTLDDYVADGIATDGQATYLHEAILAKKNILISGGTGSGKTTLANALLLEIAETDDRVILIEDTLELQCPSANKTSLRTCATSTLQDLLRLTLRLRPDRIIVGEVRGGEALDLLKAWNTGTPGGVATIHADTASKALMRLEQLVSEVSVSSQRYVISETINVVVQIKRTALGREITEILEVQGLSPNTTDYQTNLIIPSQDRQPACHQTQGDPV